MHGVTEMEDSNFYAYLYGGGTAVPTFDEAADAVKLSDEESVNRAFVAYLEENSPGAEIKDSLLEEKFYLSGDDGEKGDKTLLRYDMEIPGVEGDFSTTDLQRFFEDFLDSIGAKDGDGGNKYVVEVDARDNERGGTDIEIYVAVEGKQVEG